MTNHHNSKIINLRTGTAALKREEILRYYNETLAIEEQLYTSLTSDAAFYQRADALRHPIIFYYGHTAVFFVNKLILAKLIDQRIDPELESIFAIGVDEMSWDDLNEQHYKWPTVEDTKRYRHKVSAMVRQLIETIPLELPINWESPIWPIIMGIEHLRIHIETSSVLIRQLALEHVNANTLGKSCRETGSAPENELIEVAGGTITMGKKKDHQLYGWDNEYGKKTEEIHPFKASKYLVSNKEFLGFVDDGGYNKKDYWTEEGWNWRSYTKAEQPLFWIKEQEDYSLRLMDEVISMPWDWPVEVNYLEAKAFCNWKSEQSDSSIRMPSEAEWLHLYESQQVQDIDEWEKAPGNINLEHYSSPCPINLFKFNNFYDIIGNVWQWTETPISGYPGFKVHPLYDDFSAPTFDNKHNLFKGGSWISTGNEASKHARYAFRRHFYQHAGFRYIASDHLLDTEDNSYEDDAAVAISCEENYGDTVLGFNNFYEEIHKLSLKLIPEAALKKVLDINCDTGRLAFELSKDFAQVTALDSSARFIKMAIQMQEKGNIRYIMKNEGKLVHYQEKLLKSYNISHEEAQKIQFMQTDAANIKSIYSGYDLIIATGLLEELYDPKKFLLEAHKRINDKGLLIIGSSYDWNVKTTKEENWLGGFKKDGEPVYSFEGVSEVLTPHFSLVETHDIPKAYRLSSRKYEVQQMEIGVWQKRCSRK